MYLMRADVFFNIIQKMAMQNRFSSQTILQVIVQLQKYKICIYEHKLQLIKLCNQWHKMTEVAINKGFKSNIFSNRMNGASLIRFISFENIKVKVKDVKIHINSLLKIDMPFIHIPDTLLRFFDVLSRFQYAVQAQSIFVPFYECHKNVVECSKALEGKERDA